MTPIIRLIEDPDTSTHHGSWVGAFYPYSLALVDAQWSPVDITTGTLSVTFSDDTTGLPYTFPTGTFFQIPVVSHLEMEEAHFAISGCM